MIEFASAFTGDRGWASVHRVYTHTFMTMASAGVRVNTSAHIGTGLELTAYTEVCPHMTYIHHTSYICCTNEIRSGEFDRGNFLPDFCFSTFDPLQIQS